MTTAKIRHLNIISATYGGRDFTSFVQKQFANFLVSNPEATSWTIDVGNKFFLVDPNFDVHKACVVVYQYYLAEPSEKDREIEYYSPFLTLSGHEDDSITSAPGDTTFQPYSAPSPTASNEYVVAAYWWTANVTSQVQCQFQPLTQSPDLVGGTPITISESSLVLDPASGTKKQCTIVYGRYINEEWYYCTKVDLQESSSWKLIIPPAIPALQNRRLNIYSATWGGEDYTDYVRNQYISDTINKPPTKTSNVWTFTPGPSFFGPDPNPGVPKMSVLVYRLAALKSVEKGHLIDPHAPPVWSQDWYDQKPPLLDTPSYPVLGDVFGFRNSSATAGKPLSIDLSQVEVRPLDRPALAYPWVVSALYSNLDVTTWVVNSVYQQTIQSHPTSYKIPVSVADFGDNDPWPGVTKQLTITVGYPTTDEIGYQMCTFVQLVEASNWEFTFPAAVPAQNAQWPQAFKPALYRNVKFVDHGLATVWPQVWQNGRVFWSPRPSNTAIAFGDVGKSGLTPPFASTVDLIKDAGCKDGQKYSLNFNCLTIEDSPMGPEFYVGVNPTEDMTFTYHIDKKVAIDAYYIGRIVQVGIQVIGLIIEAFAD